MRRGRGTRVGLVALGLTVMLVWFGLDWSAREPPSPRGAEVPKAREIEPGTVVGEGAMTVEFGHGADDPLVAGLNARGGTGGRDLQIVVGVLEAWQSNFPGQGNPGGENREIVAELTGRNRLGVVLIPADHPAINDQGELCDRWGTPLFFHALAGDVMELRSAGPDREFYTTDDVTAGGLGGTGRNEDGG